MILYGGNSGLIDDVYFLTAQNSANFNSAIVMTNINHYYDMFVNEILDAQDDWDFEGQIATANIVANQQDYAFPTDILKAKRLEISYDGTNWYAAQPMDENDYRLRSIGLSADVNDYFDETCPYFAAHDNSLYLYPVPDTAVTSGLKLWYSDQVVPLSAATMSPVFQKAYHRGLSYGVAKDWFQKIGDQQKSVEMNAEMEKIIARMKNFYSNRFQDREYRLKPLIENYG